MSASQQKKQRKQLREQGVEKHQVAMQKAEEKARRAKTRNTIVGVIAALAIIAIILFNSTLFYRNFSAVTIGDESYNASEVSFFYNLEYSNFITQNSSALQYMGLDTTKSLKSQSFGEDQTWADFFLDSAITYLKEITMLSTEAAKAGFEMGEEYRTALETELTSMEAVYKEAGYSSVDSFIAANYGKGCDYKLVSALMEKIFLARAYAEHVGSSYTYTPAELENHYLENKDSYDNFTYLSYFADGSVDEESETDAEAAMADAKKIADGLVEDADNESEFIGKVSALTETEVTETNLQGSSLASDYSDWMIDSARKPGDKTVIETQGGYYALYFISRDGNEFNTASVRHILTYVEPNENGEYSEDAKAEAKAKAEEVLLLWKSGEATDESFAALANEYSDDAGSNTNGGLYEEFKPGAMVKEFNDWSFAPTRKPGDTGIVYNEGSYTGYHIIYYVDEGRSYRQVLADKALRNEDFTQWKTESLEDYVVVKGSTARFVG